MTGSLRDLCPGLKSKRSREQFQAVVHPPGRKGYAVTTELRRGTSHRTMWRTSTTFRLETRIPSVPTLKRCVIHELRETVVPYNRENPRDRNNCQGLLEGEEVTVFHQAGRRTRQDLQHPTQQASLQGIAHITAWSVERRSVWSPASKNTSASTPERSHTLVESVVAASASRGRWRLTSAYTRVRSHTPALSVETASATWTVYANTGARTQVRNPTCAPSAGSVSVACSILNTTSSSTQGKDPAVAPSATAPSRSRQLYGNTSAHTARKAATWELAPAMTLTQTPSTTWTISIRQPHHLRWGLRSGELRRRTAQWWTVCREPWKELDERTRVCCETVTLIQRTVLFGSLLIFPCLSLTKTNLHHFLQHSTDSSGHCQNSSGGRVILSTGRSSLQSPLAN